jgi:hypothetical protein
MRFVDPPTFDSPWREQPGDDLDGLLTAFFRSELPSPWPGAPEPEEAEVIVRPMPRARRPIWGSRLALAASVALLLAGGWMLSGSFSDTPGGSGSPKIDGISADRDTGEPSRRMKVVPSIQEQPGGNTGLRIDVFLPDDKQDGTTEKDLKGQLQLPPE